MKFAPLLFLLLLTGCGLRGGGPETLPAARRGFKTTLTAQARQAGPAETAPPSIFRTLKYPSPVGELTAYLTPDPGDGKKHPAIIWITGGDCNSIGDVWSQASRDNDQTASAFRKAGIVMMFPSLRGGNDNPGTKEGFLGEVDDVLAAADFLEKQPYVDASRLYLGGHSTGGTLVLLTAQCSPRFRNVFSFGPVEDVAGYGADSGFLPIDISNEQEVKLRSPGYWMHAVQSPVWIIEGESGSSNIDSLQAMKRAHPNSRVNFLAVPRKDHFSVLSPINQLLADKILKDTGPQTNIMFVFNDVQRAAEK